MMNNLIRLVSINILSTLSYYHTAFTAALLRNKLANWSKLNVMEHFSLPFMQFRWVKPIHIYLLVAKNCTSMGKVPGLLNQMIFDILRKTSIYFTILVDYFSQFRLHFGRKAIIK